MLNKAYPYANNHNPGYKQKNRRKKYMKRKLLCVLLSTAMISTMISGCGSVTTTDESGNAQSSAAVASSQEAASNQSEASEATTSAAATGENADISGDITIWDWDGDTAQKYVDEFKKAYPNVNVNIQDVSWDDYIEKLQTSYVSGMDIPDIIYGEMAWRGSLYEMDILDNLEEAPYNLNREDMVDSSVPLCSDPNGNIVGVEMQVTPAGFAYKRDLAKEYLGTDDPDEVGKMISTWDDFETVGKQVSEKSGGKVKMMVSLGDVLLSTLSQNTVDYVDGDTVDITAKMKEPLAETIKLRDDGIIGNVEMYSADWYNDYASEDYIFYEAGSWCPPLVISQYDPEGSGNWAVTTPPDGSFNLGGTTLSIYKDSDNKEAAWAYIQYIFFSEKGGSYMYDLTGNYSCYEPYYSSEYSPMDKEGPVDEFFGGQSLVDYYINVAAPTAKTVAQNKYDAVVSDVWQQLLPQYMSDNSIDSDKALSMFINAVQEKEPEATIK